MSAILVVDDDPHLRELARVFLRHEGFDVYEAGDGVEALALLERLKVELVILDILMPKMDGWELCRQLRSWYDVPVLMLTAKGETSQQLYLPYGGSRYSNSMPKTIRCQCRLIPCSANLGTSVPLCSSAATLCTNWATLVAEQSARCE